MNKQTVLVLDFGGQYKELIARRIRQCGVFSHIVPGSTTVEKIAQMAPVGIIITGDNSYAECDPGLFALDIPVLSIDKGAELMVLALGGEVSSFKAPEDPKVEMRCSPYCALFEGQDIAQTGYFVNDSCITRMPEGFDFITVTDDLPMAGVSDESRKLYALQFHPEMSETPSGAAMIRNFLFNICGAEKDHTLDSVGRQLMQLIRDQAAGRKVLLGVSGGGDSSVCAALMAKAIPGQLTCVFVDHGLMGENDAETAVASLKELGIDVVCVNAAERFFSALKGVEDTVEKRRIMEAELMSVFEQQAALVGAEVLALGTVYNDLMNGAEDKNSSAFAAIIEPMNWLFKDEAHAVGARIGMSGDVLYRQSFPCSGLATRIQGEVTPEKAAIVKAADAIFAQEMEDSIVTADQHFAMLKDVSGESIIILRAVTKTSLMGVEYAPVTQGVLARVSGRIQKEIKGVSRVLFDITADEYAPVEW